MMIFVKPFILFCVFISPVQMESWKLNMADFNTGATVFTDDVSLNMDEDGPLEIITKKGKRTFCSWDFRTMLGSFVELDILDFDQQVRCVFESSLASRAVFTLLKPDPDIENDYPLHSIFQVVVDDEERMATSIHTQVIIGGTLVDEFRNRFIVYSQEKKPVLVFSTGHFNVSSVLTLEQILVVIQVYDIEKQEFVMVKFIVRFKTQSLAEAFHRYVTKESSCTNSMIPVDVHYTDDAKTCVHFDRL